MKKSDNLVLVYDYDEEVVLNNCCGILEIGGLNIEVATDDLELQLFEVNPEKILKNNSVGMILATTIGMQKNCALKLAELGFKKLETVKNPKTKNTITLWCYKRKPAVKKKVTKC